MRVDEIGSMGHWRGKMMDLGVVACSVPCMKDIDMVCSFQVGCIGPMERYRMPMPVK